MTQVIHYNTVTGVIDSIRTYNGVSTADESLFAAYGLNVPPNMGAIAHPAPGTSVVGHMIHGGALVVDPNYVAPAPEPSAPTASPAP